MTTRFYHCTIDLASAESMASKRLFITYAKGKEDQHGSSSPYSLFHIMTLNHKCQMTDNTGDGSLCHWGAVFKPKPSSFINLHRTWICTPWDEVLWKICAQLKWEICIRISSVSVFHKIRRETALQQLLMRLLSACSKPSYRAPDQHLG